MRRSAVGLFALEGDELLFVWTVRRRARGKGLQDIASSQRAGRRGNSGKGKIRDRQNLPSRRRPRGFSTKFGPGSGLSTWSEARTLRMGHHVSRGQVASGAEWWPLSDSCRQPVSHARHVFPPLWLDQ